MKTLIVYYSRTGLTKKLAENLAISLNADIEVIVDNIDRRGVTGFLKSGREGLSKKEVKIQDFKNDIGSYDLIIIGSPVWAGSMASPVRSFITKYQDKISKTAFFMTQGSFKEQGLFKEIDEIFGEKLISKEFFAAKEIVKNNFNDKLNNFITKLK